MSWIWERAATARLALRLSGFGRYSDVYRLLDWIGEENLVVKYSQAVSKPQLWDQGDGRGKIKLPYSRYTDAPLDLGLLEEGAHYLCGHGISAFLNGEVDPNCPRWDRAIRQTESKEEAEAQRFILDLLLPPDRCRMLRSAQAIASEAGCDLALARRRLDFMPLRECYFIPAVPAWCAAQELRAEKFPAPAGFRLCVSERDKSATYEFHSDRRGWDDLWFRVGTDLLARTPGEWRRRYHAHRCEGVGMPLTLNTSAMYRMLEAWEAA
jgi:hypothetical protein